MLKIIKGFFNKLFWKNYFRQSSANTLAGGFLIVFYCISGVSYAEGTKQIEPVAPYSYCRITIAKDDLSDRVPFALIDCSEEYKLNIRINNFANEKIYLGFGNVRDYGLYGDILNDVSFQIKDPAGNVVPGYQLMQIPANAGLSGFIVTKQEAFNGPNINNSNPDGYAPLILNPTMNGDYVLEFGFQLPFEGIMRSFEFFDVTVANGLTPIPGRLWSKAWQLSSGSVSSIESASFGSFFMYSNDSIVTNFQSNGLAGGIWVIYSNEWGCAKTGTWSERRKSVLGNANVPPQYKIFLNDPDPAVFPTGVVGEMISATALPHVCDTVINFAATVSKGGNIEILIDVPPLNPGAFGPEDVQLGYSVLPGYNVLLPGWDGKNAFGDPVPNGAQVEAKITFLNGLTNIPLHDVEDNRNGFKVDIHRPIPQSGNTKLKIFWDDTGLPPSTNPTSNVLQGCIYTNIDPVTGCHNWNFDNSQLGNLNTINSWWYYSTEDELVISITLELLPRKGNISGPANLCAGANATFKTTIIPSAPTYMWNISGPGLSIDFERQAPDTTFTYQFIQGMPSGIYTISVYGLNPECGPGSVAYKEVVLFDIEPSPLIGSQSACAFAPSGYLISGIFSSIQWSSGRGEVIGSAENNYVTFLWNSVGPDTIRVYAVSPECGERLSTLPINVHPVANAKFTVSAEATSCPGLPLTFTDNSELDSGSIIGRKWEWDDGLSDNVPGSQVTHAFADTGIYNVRLTVTTNNGCKSDTVNQVEVIPYPEAAFSSYSNCTSQAIELNDISSGADITLWKWDFGNAPVTATNLDLRQPTVVFHEAGQFPVRLIVTNQYGCVDTVVQQVEIHNPPIAAYSYELPCQSKEIVFSDESIPVDTTLIKYNWYAKSSPDDERHFEGNPITIIFDQVKEYEVGLEITDAFGCVGSTFSTISVVPKPISAFNYFTNESDLNGVLRFENQTTGAINYFWDFDNNFTSTLFQPVTRYELEGNYTIILISMSAEGCPDTTSRSYYYSPDVYMPNAFTPDYNGRNDVFKPFTGRNTLEPYSLQIFNRWGQLIFNSSDPEKGWDGTADGKLCEKGVYVYVLKYREGIEGSSKIITIKGTVTLIR